MNWSLFLDSQGKVAAIFAPPASPHFGEKELIAAVTRELERESLAGRFAGAVLIAKDGTPIFARAYGLAGLPQ